MLLNELPTCITSPIKRTPSQSSIKSPNNFDNDYGSVFAENETIADIQPRVLFNDTNDPEGFYPKVDETKEKDNFPTRGWTIEKKKIQCCSNRIGFIPLISSIAIFINIMALVIIALNVITPTQLSTTTPIKEILLGRSSVRSSFVYMRDSIEVSSYYTSTYFGCYLMYISVQLYNESVYNISKLIPPTFDHPILKDKQNPIEAFFPMWDTWTRMESLICNQVMVETNETSYIITDEESFAQFMEMNNETFKFRMQEFELELTSFLDGLYHFCHTIDEYTTGGGISVLVLSCLSCVLVIPVGLFVFMVLGRKLNVNDKKVKTANNLMLKDTMADVGMREEFRIYCRKSKVEIPFKILERIQYFKEHCKESVDIQLKLFEITKDYVATHDSDVDKTKDIIIKQISNEIEKKISHLDRLKYETIFEIMELIQMESVGVQSIDWVVHQLDLYNNREDSYESIDIIHSKVMDNLEREVSDFLTYTHFQFKSTNGLNMNTSPNSPTLITPTQI